MRIGADTRFVTLIGTPLRQSYAARMHNAAYEAAGLDLLYFYTEQGSEHLGELIGGIRHMPFAGFAVTKPNKVRVLAYLDELDPLCRRAGACNTVVKTADGRLVGYNTDAEGFYTALTQDGGVRVPGERFFCFGCGGAGRAICAALAAHGAQRVFVTDADASRGEALSRELSRNFSAQVTFVRGGAVPGALAQCAAVLNATGVGMGESAGQSPMPGEWMDARQFYFDACYNPAQTQFLRDAAARGCRTMNGLSMSLYQGAAQFALWTGCEPPLAVMRRELLAILAEQAAQETQKTQEEGQHAHSQKN